VDEREGIMTPPRDPEDWAESSKKKWGVDKGQAPPNFQLEKKLVERRRRQNAHQVARAIFNCQHLGSKAYTEAAKILNELPGPKEEKRKWTYEKVKRYAKMKECHKYFANLEKQASKVALHTKEQWREKASERGYGEPSGVLKDDFTVKPLSEWTEDEKKLIDGVDYKFRSTVVEVEEGKKIVVQELVPIVKMVDRRAYMEMLGKDLGIFKETTVLEHPDTEAIRKALGVVVEDVWGGGKDNDG
jgi:hypothetical protein